MIPTFQGTKYVELAPDIVFGGPGHIRFAVMIPAFSALSHIYGTLSVFRGVNAV